MLEVAYVYILRCFDGTFYVGVTNDVDRRVAEHHDGRDLYCYTYNRRPLKLAYVGEFQRMTDAIAFEKQLKGWSHRKKRVFTEGNFADLKRFARGPNKPRPS